MTTTPAPSPPEPAAAPAGMALLVTPLGALVTRAPVLLPPTASITEAARTMRDARVSSVLLVEQGQLFGIVTDRDLRSRALAAGLDPARAVWEIATAAPLTLQASAPALDALLLMARAQVHHVPVLDGTRIVGMVTATDLAQRESASPAFLADDVRRQPDVAGLAAAATRVPLLQRQLAEAHATALASGHAITAIADAITVRLLQLAEARLGPPPVDYAWVAAGSQARQEQTARSDQDNALVLADAYDEAAHGAYFHALANLVNDGLAACGYVHCPGEMMARHDPWRQPRARWAAHFAHWTGQPEPQALMLTCVFFDMRFVAGSASLLDSLRREVLERTRGNRLFLALLTANAIRHRPPLTLLRGIATQPHGGLRDAVDLKMGGLAPVIELARVCALAIGHEAVGTHERLLVAAQSGEMAERDARDLREAFEFIGGLRLRHQAAQLARGEPVDNFLSLGTLSAFERGQLKDAFGVVQMLQAAMSQRWR